MKYSIIIPTWNRCGELLRPCLESIVGNTTGETMAETEVIVVANGCTDETEGYVRSLPSNFVLVSYPEPMGYPRAVNAGIKIARGEFVVLMNNDCQVLPYRPKDEWLDRLRARFDDPMMGAVGPKKITTEDTGEWPFVVFFLVMLRREMFDRIGMLDESFTPGGGEDIDFCWRLVKEGYKLGSIPDDEVRFDYASDYPIYHKAEATVHGIPEWEP
ncbi:MAG: glycosyltransferase family 2 protein, partial [Thaumarchaeota archaeon]|nr:glycosyltransferase family 2 protein [Nitrososphaerota archaeon]